MAAMFVAVGGCSDLSSDPPPIRHWGTAVIEGTTTAENTVAATARALFFDAATAAVTNSTAAAQTDACGTFGVDTSTVETVGKNQAGESLALKIGEQTIPMNWVPVSFWYASPTATPFTYTSGQSVALTVPGNGDVYPAGTVSVVLAEPLIVPSVTVQTNQPLDITWNGSSTTSSAVLLNLIYASPGSGYGNRQVICELKDDGAAVIPTSLLADFYTSPPVYRKLTLTRFRTNQVDIDSRTLLHINSSVSTTATLQ